MSVDMKDIAVDDSTLGKDEFYRYFNLDDGRKLTAEGRALFEKWRSMGEAQYDYRREYGYGWSDSDEIKPLPDGVKYVVYHNDDPASCYLWGFIDERPESKTFTNVHDYGLWSLLAQSARLYGLEPDPTKRERG